MELEPNNQTIPPQIPLQAKKWYQHRGIIVVGALLILTALVSWLALSRQPKTEPVVVNQNEVSSASTSPSNVSDAVQITSIHDLHVANATTKISPGSVIMIYWNAPAGYSIPLTGDKNGDGVWVSNGSYSAYLNYVSREIDNTPDAKNATGVYLVDALCPGAETMDCSLDKKIPFTEGEYALYIKTDDGKTKSKDFKITILSTPSAANYGNVSYTIFNSKTECSDQGYNTVDYCNGALGKVDGSTKKYSVIIPNLWKTLPELKDTPGLMKLLFSNKDNLFFEVFGITGGEGFAFDIGYYRYDLLSNGITKLEWASGNCTAASPDGAYLADDYDVSGKTQIKVFSLADNKYVWSTTLPASQSVNDGTYGMGCNSSLKFDNDDTLTYTIFDASKPSDGQIPYTAITDKKQPFPTVTQMFPAK